MLEFENEHYIGKASPAQGGGGVSPFTFMTMITTGEMTSESSFDVEFERELGDLSTETYNASFTFEPVDEENNLWSIVGGTLTKDGTEIGTAELYVQVAEYNGAMSTYQKLPNVLTKSVEDAGTVYSFNLGYYECYILIEAGENDAISITDGSAYVGENSVGSCDLYLKIPPQPLPEE